MALTRRNRQSERQHLPHEQRTLLLEQDADALEHDIVEMREQVRTINRVMVGLLVSVVTGILLLLVQLLIDIAREGLP